VDGLTGLFLPKTPAGIREAEYILSSPELVVISGEIQRTIRSLKDAEGGGDVILVIDQLDLLLAAGGDQFTAANLGEMLIGLREVCDFSREKFKRIAKLTFRQDVYSTILSLSADYPLVSATQTPLERDHAAFVLNIAHEADFTMSLRLLDTGTARDVGGVLRVTIGGNAEQDGQDIQKKIEERELLYFVGGDGGVKVFERG
jgi:elongator complex protein 6